MRRDLGIFDEIYSPSPSGRDERGGYFLSNARLSRLMKDEVFDKRERQGGILMVVLITGRWVQPVFQYIRHTMMKAVCTF